MGIRSRRRSGPAGPLATLTDQELEHLRDQTGRLFDMCRPPLPGFERPDREWLAWGQEMRRRGLPLCARSWFEVHEAGRIPEVPGAD